MLAVDVSNVSPHKIRVWETNNSWGWWNWRVVVIRSRSIFLVERNPDQEFTGNFRAYDELAVGQKKTKLLNMQDGDWICNRQKGFLFQKDDEILVIYHVSETPESKTDRVWTGIVTAYYKNP
ncbi:MAG: hypothetical protein INR73_22480 [Williamsia sp.]|nr:hypothetical protein [Williamsia sp.]